MRDYFKCLPHTETSVSMEGTNESQVLGVLLWTVAAFVQQV